MKNSFCCNKPNFAGLTIWYTSGWVPGPGAVGLAAQSRRSFQSVPSTATEFYRLAAPEVVSAHETVLDVGLTWTHYDCRKQRDIVSKCKRLFGILLFGVLAPIEAQHLELARTCSCGFSTFLPRKLMTPVHIKVCKNTCMNEYLQEQGVGVLHCPLPWQVMGPPPR